MSHTTAALLDSHLRIKISTLPHGAKEAICDALTIDNVEREKAKKQNIWGWRAMPEYIELWKIEDDNLICPRGFADTFGRTIREYYEKPITWFDNRTFESEFFDTTNRRAPKEWQQPAIEAIKNKHQGIYKAPSASGKTAVILFTIHDICCKSLIIINTKDILWQWQKRIEEFLGPVPTGQIGDNVFEVSDYITISTAQTLHRRYETLKEDGFFEQFSLVCLDECHHSSAETYYRLMDSFTAKYRIGVSATPEKAQNFELSKAVLGPIIHETRVHEVDILQKPSVIRVTTDFKFGFRGNKGGRRSNYPQMIDALIHDEDRNLLIMGLLKKEETHHCLLLSKRLEHLDILENLAHEYGYQGEILKLTGSESREDRKEAKAIAEDEPCLLLSTLADEAFDVQRMDRLFLVFPQRNHGLITQQVGRVERKHPDKKDAIIYDFADLKVGALQSQWRARRFEVYDQRGYDVKTIKAKDL